jgi:hypothetical protein
MGVGFYHLDGCNMDDEFAFSSYRTRAEWEIENRRREEFDKDFNCRYEARPQRIARGEVLESDPSSDPDPFPSTYFNESGPITSDSSDDDETELSQ